MNQFKKLNNYIGWSIFLIASFVYLSTIEQTVSFWDCGEYIATAYKLEVGHPPGAPFFQLFGRIFTLFASQGTSEVAVAINILSALCSSFAILFLFWTITAFGRKLFLNDEKEIEESWLDGAKVIGLTAGASTPEAIVQRCIQRLKELGVTEVENVVYTQEDVVFQLPKPIVNALFGSATNK